MKPNFCDIAVKVFAISIFAIFIHVIKVRKIKYDSSCRHCFFFSIWHWWTVVLTYYLALHNIRQHLLCLGGPVAQWPPLVSSYLLSIIKLDCSNIIKVEWHFLDFISNLVRDPIGKSWQIDLFLIILVAQCSVFHCIYLQWLFLHVRHQGG